MRTIAIVSGIVTLSVLAGCGQFSARPAGGVSTSNPSPAPATDNPNAKAPQGQSQYLRDLSVGSGGGDSTGAVEQALQWSQRYSKMAEQYVALQREKQATDDKLREAQASLVKNSVELTQTQKELKDANDALLEQKKQLAEWKKSITGLQGRNQEALAVIIEKQERIIELLGGEVPRRAATLPVSKATDDKSQVSSAGGGK